MLLVLAGIAVLAGCAAFVLMVVAAAGLGALTALLALVAGVVVLTAFLVFVVLVSLAVGWYVVRRVRAAQRIRDPRFSLPT